MGVLQARLHGQRCENVYESHSCDSKFLLRKKPKWQKSLEGMTVREYLLYLLITGWYIQLTVT